MVVFGKRDERRLQQRTGHSHFIVTTIIERRLVLYTTFMIIHSSVGLCYNSSFVFMASTAHIGDRLHIPVVRPHRPRRIHVSHASRPSAFSFFRVLVPGFSMSAARPAALHSLYRLLGFRLHRHLPAASAETRCNVTCAFLRRPGLESKLMPAEPFLGPGRSCQAARLLGLLLLHDTILASRVHFETACMAYKRAAAYLLHELYFVHPTRQ